MITRRGFLKSILAAGVAPAYVKADSLMGLYIPQKPAKFICTTRYGMGWCDPRGVLGDIQESKLFKGDLFTVNDNGIIVPAKGKDKIYGIVLNKEFNR